MCQPEVVRMEMETPMRILKHFYRTHGKETLEGHVQVAVNYSIH